MVIVGDRVGESQDRTIVGDAPMLAARLQALVQPDMVAIGPTTRLLIGDLFDCRDLGAIGVERLAGPVPAWQVMRASAIASRFEALRGSPLTRLVGRGEEIDLLLRRWSRAKAGDGQVVLVSGEPGIGKSRLCAELEARLDAEPHRRLRYFCSPYYQDSALFPFIDQLGRAAGFARDDPPAAKLEKLEALLGPAVPEEDVALLADLMLLRASEHHPLPNLSPQRKKERTLAALTRKLEGLARQQPVIMVFEDAQWSDPTSQELLDLIIERVRSLPVLLIVTFRPEFEPQWTGQPRVTMLALNRLDWRDRTVLVAQLAGGKALPDGVVKQIADRTDGIPLFVEELTKSVLESGVTPLGIPTTLHDSLMARLDRLGPVKPVAQIGAAIGRDFSYALLRAVSRVPEDELQASLARLAASELVFQRGVPPDAIYSFKHALVQDAAHDSLLRSPRRQLHAGIATALEALCPEMMDSQPELFAQHYAEAGLADKSALYWTKAGHRSAARSAMAEAATQFQKGLDQLALLPDTRERQRREIELHIGLAGVLIAAKGPGAPETRHSYDRARELWAQLGCPSEFLGVPYGQSVYHLHRGEFDMAQRLDEDLLRVSRWRNDPGRLVLGHYSCGRTLLYRGQFARARVHLEEAIALYDPIADRLLLQAGIRPWVAARATFCICLFCLGYPDQALAQAALAVAEARELGHLPSLAIGLDHLARLLTFIVDIAALSEPADQLVALAIEQGFSYWRALGNVYRGWAMVKSGDVAAGLSLLRSGAAASRAAGAVLWAPSHLTLLAAASEIAGEMEDALALLDDALTLVERTGGLWLAAELNRCKGQLVLQRGNTEAAEELYRKARSTAAEQGAKLWELRAAVSLARLRRDQNRRAEARDLLVPVYSWFTEGFETPDLKEAKAVLDTLR